MSDPAISCFHCHQQCPTDHVFQFNHQGQPLNFCCPGCQAVAETIFAQGLGDYYKFRTEASAKAAAIPEQLLAQLKNYDSQDVLEEVAIKQGQLHTIELSVSGMSCAACAWLIEKQLKHHTAVSNIVVNSATARCELTWRSDQLPLSQILQQIAALGYSAMPYVADDEEHHYKTEMHAYMKRLAISGIMSMQVMMLAFGLYFGDFTGIEGQYERYLRWVSLLLTIPVMLYSAKPFFVSASRGVKARELNMDVPISLALLYTFFASVYATVSHTGEVYYESVCMFVFLLQLGKFFEFRARKQARDATSNLLKILPVSATVWDGNNGHVTSARRLNAGQHILVKAGETMPADGHVIEGQSSADESMLTGEYRAIPKSPGDLVLAGSINHDGALVVAVEKSLTESRLGQIIRLQQQTLHQKPALLEKTDRIARFFVQRLLVVATATFLVWYFYIDPSRAFWVTLSVMVATCPCALSLATPTAITCGLARLNRQGILIRNQEVLEVLPQVHRVFLDKTGTLTEGRFSIERTEMLAAASGFSYSQEQWLNLAASMELRSEHPIAKAFRPYLQHAETIEHCQLVVGGGLTATWRSHSIRLGSAKFCQITLNSQASVYLCVNDQPVMAIWLTDQLRPEVRDLVATLRARNIAVSLLTGDHSAHVETVAAELAIDDVHKGCSPEDKVHAIQHAVQRGDKVIMVGDGINDSPCFQAAHVSVALDSGSDLSKNSADVVLLHNDLSGLVQLIDVAQQAQTKIRQNLWWAFGYNLVIVPLAVCGYVSPYVAVIGMSVSSILVVSNSLRLVNK